MGKFIVEHRFWLSFIVILNVALNCIWLLDDGLANVSVIYMNIVYVAFALLFCIIRFQVDNHIRKSIEQVELTPLKREIADYYEQKLEEATKEYQKLKWQTSEANDELLAWVHEMKSPLTAMRLMLDVLPNNAQKRKLEAEWLRIYMLLDQQLHITRLQTIEQDSRLQRVNVKEIVVQEIKALQSWCMEKGIGLQLDELNLELVTDAKWLAFIIRQYLSNAIKYSPENSEIEISLGETDQGHKLLKIADDGPGIAAHDLPRVFKKSYTGTKGRESAVASGMGLYLAKQAAETIGLKLYLQSRERTDTPSVQHGTIAVIQFPIQNEYTKQLGM